MTVGAETWFSAIRGKRNFSLWIDIQEFNYTCSGTIFIMIPPISENSSDQDQEIP